MLDLNYMWIMQTRQIVFQLELIFHFRGKLITSFISNSSQSSVHASVHFEWSTKFSYLGSLNSNSSNGSPSPSMRFASWSVFSLFGRALTHLEWSFPWFVLSWPLTISLSNFSFFSQLIIDNENLCRFELCFWRVFQYSNFCLIFQIEMWIPRYWYSRWYGTPWGWICRKYYQNTTWNWSRRLFVWSKVSHQQSKHVVQTVLL